jgi:hypothetical protein
MRKREIEKQLYLAVAEALGVEPKAPRRTLARKVASTASFRKPRHDQHHRAAA